MSGLVLCALAAWGKWAPSRGAAASYSLAVAALRADQPAQAEQLLQVVLSEDADCGVCQHAMAAALLRQQRSAEATALLVPLAHRYSRREVLTLLAVASLASGELPRAQEAAAAAVRADRTDLDAQRLLLRVLLLQGDRDAARWVVLGARGHLRPAQWGCLEAERAAAGGDRLAVQGAMAACQGAEDATAVAEASLLLAQTTGELTELEAAATALGLAALAGKARAAQLLEAGAVAEALAELEAAGASADPDALVLRAWGRRASGDIDGALADLEAALAPRVLLPVRPSGAVLVLSAPEQLRAQAQGLHARLLIEQGRLEEAEDALAEGSGGALSAAALRLRLAQGRPEDAAAILSAALLQWPTEPELPAAALLLAASAPLTEDAVAWLQALPSPGPALHLATLAYRDGHYARCVDTLSPLADPRALSLAHRCAVAGGDLETASALLHRMASPSIAPDVRLRHAWLLGEDGQQTAALALLEPLTSSAARSLRLSLLTDAGRLDEALALHGEGAVAPAHTANLATALHRAGRTGAARQLMAEACAAMSGGDAQRCAAGLARM